MKITKWIFIFIIFLQGKCWALCGSCGIGKDANGKCAFADYAKGGDFMDGDPCSTLVYVDVGILLPVPIPSVGVGLRFQDNQHGGDFSIHGGTIGTYSQVKGAIIYHYYPYPNFESQFYLGSGIGASWTSYPTFSHDSSFCLSPEFVFGRQFKIGTGKLRFWQIQVSVPTYFFSKKEWLGWPIIGLYYGFFF